MKYLMTCLAVIKTVLLVFATPSVAEPAVWAAMPAVRVPITMDLRSALTLPRFDAVQEIEALCLAAALYHEARGESQAGQLAVARVILNRKRSRVYPSSICGVVYQGAEKPFRCQFSFACDDLPDFPRNQSAFARLHAMARAIVATGMTGRLLPGDPHEYREGDYDKITHYHTVRVSPFWSSKIAKIGQIGRHVFYRSDRVARSL